MQSARHYGATSDGTTSSAAQRLSDQQVPPDDEPWRAKVLITGMRRSGKTSVQEVVFNSLPPKDSFFLEATSKITKLDIDSPSFVRTRATLHLCKLNPILGRIRYLLLRVSLLVAVRYKDDYYHPIAHLVHLVATVAEVNPSVHLEVFVHKAEALSDEYKVEHFRHIQSRIIDELLDHPASALLTNMPLNFYLTSVYDHTIYEAFSRVVQRLVPQLATLENLLNTLVSTCGIAKAFLFDITCLVYVATDASPVDNASFELCCDYVQTLVSFSNLYKNLRPHSITAEPASSSHAHSPVSSIPSSPSTSSHGATQTKGRPKAPLKSHPDQDESPSSSPSHSLISTTKSQSSPPPGAGSSLQRKDSQKSSTLTKNGSANTMTGSQTLDRLLPAEKESKRWATSAAKLNPESTLAYWQITDTLSLVCLTRSQTYEEHRGLVEYNVTFFRGAVQKIVQMELAKRNP
ncbi:hypothetical protein FRB99_008000 [Tulasnella sp. 403]|nr:hypothetical protein FRB99_008000 [Tulasnella sp. 403]